MQENIVTNEMLYDLLKEFKRDVHKRFEQVDRRFEQVDKRFEQLEENQSEEHKLLMDLWENRSKNTLNFSSTYFIVTLICSILAATATAALLR